MNRNNQLSLISILFLLLGSVAFVSVVALNETPNNSSGNLSLNFTSNESFLNETKINISMNETLNISSNETSVNNTILNESINQTINETEPINISTNETENLTEDISEPVVKETGTNQTINETIVQEFVPINKSNQSITIVDTNITIKEGLAKVYNGDILNYDRNFEKKYLEVYNNFSDIEFSRISETAPVDMKVGAVNKNIKGLNINNKTYAIHLIACDQHYNSCNFRINGVPTRKIYSSELSKSGVQKNFRFDEDYELEIKSIKFKFCDNRRFCDYYYESYDLVEVKIVER